MPPYLLWPQTHVLKRHTASISSDYYGGPLLGTPDVGRMIGYGALYVVYHSARPQSSATLAATVYSQLDLFLC